MNVTAYLTHKDYRLHTMREHPEHAGRIERIWKVFAETEITKHLLNVTPQPAAIENLELVHTPRLIERVYQISARGGGWIDGDTYAIAPSYDIGLLAVGGTIGGVDAILSGKAQNALAIVRPPGHHATSDRSMGFCLFNNVAVAVRYAQKNYPDVDHVMIIDFDVHHGNGTQEIFYDDPSVLYVSTHQHPFYPGSGGLMETGRGEAGTILNMPMRAGTGNTGVLKLYKEIVWPIARRFKPDLIMVSAGFDAHWADPLAMIQLDLKGYAHLTRELIAMAEELCKGRIAFVLEGGYDLDVLSYGLLNVAYALLGMDKVVDPLGEFDMPEQGVDLLVEELQRIHNL